MKFHATMIATALLLGGARTEGVAFDLTIVDDNFDSYADQAAFVSAWPRYSATTTSDATLNTAQSVSMPKSVSFAPTGNNNEQRNKRSFSEPFFVGEKLVWSFDIRESGTIGNPQRIHMGLHAGASNLTNQLIQMGLYNNQFSTNSGGNYYMARILGHTPPVIDPDGGPNNEQSASINGGAPTASMFFKLNDFGVGLRSPGTTWRNLKVEISKGGSLGAGMHYDFFVDNVLAERVSNVGSAAQNRDYDAISLGSGLSYSTNTVHVDNMKLGIFFEPEEPEFHAGDHNEDGVVDALDYVTWRADETGNGGEQGYTDWLADYGKPPLGGGAAVGSAVPEPASLMFMLLGAAILLAGRRRA